MTQHVEASGALLGTGDGATSIFGVGAPGQVVQNTSVLNVWRNDGNGATTLYRPLAPTVALPPGRYPQFARNNVLAARTSVATYYDSAGVLKTAVANTPRITYDPSNLSAPPALLIEAASSNTLRMSQQLDSSAAWSTSGATVSADVVIAPDGAMSAEKIVESATTSVHGMLQSVTGFPAGAVSVTSIYAKAGERQSLQINTAGYGEANFNLLTGQVTNVAVSNANFSNYSAAIQDVGNGWYRCSVSRFCFAAVGSTSVRFYMNPTATSSGLTAANYIGDGISGMPMWGAQLELDTLSSYIATTNATGVRTAELTGFADYTYTDDGLVTMAAVPALGAALTWTGSYDYAQQLKVDDYLALVTTEHSDRPKYMASLRAALEQVQAGAELVEAVEVAFDIDTAVGVQLDILGEWIGRSRFIGTPLVGAYFSWDDTALDGWDSGYWKGPFDPDSGLVSLPDEPYRILLKAKIAANHWDGSIPGAYAVWQGAFGPSPAILIQDNQDMTMFVGIVGPPLDAVTKALITGGYIPLKPEGVRVNYIVSPDTGPLFAWDVTNGTTLDGWETGWWGIEL